MNPRGRNTSEATVVVVSGSGRGAHQRHCGLVPYSEMKTLEKMRRQPHLGVLSVVLILSLGLPEITLSCPHPCACYVPSEVHCTFRSLAAVPTRISKHVERINLGFNSIQAISETSFAGLAKLELLMVHGNDIQNIPNGALKDLTSLQVFKISYNKLQAITGYTLQGLSSLMRLHVDHNRIEFIHPNAFNGLTSLRLLHLEGNLLRQLHPNTFSTFTVFDYFRLSTIKHLYLSENAIETLPVDIFQKMPLLENLYLHGNPWSCDCRLKWFLSWSEKSAGVLKCKKDKAYENGQLCPKCAYPKQFQKQDIQLLKDVSCRKPIIQSPLKQNISFNMEEMEEDYDSAEPLLEEFQQSPWNITLNLTDEHGNIVNLNCEIKKPTNSTKIQWNQISSQEIDVNATISLDLECPMNRDNYEKLWKLIAYYSEVPVKLEREHVLNQEPKLSYHYRQGSDYDALYYTGVKGRIFAEPAWVMQPLIHIQLNRRQSTGKKVVLSFSTHISQTLQTQENRQQRNSWVVIEQDQYTKAAQSVVESSDAQLSCNVKASESPSINWVLPDGTKLKAPFKMENSSFSVLSSGQLIIKSVTYSDSGMYHCVAQVRGDVDTMSHRILVQPPGIQVADSETTKVEKNVGDPILLPCSAVAVPDAHLSWILPNSHVLNDLSNSSNGYMLDNGTLLIPRSHVSDSGYYRCVAINQQGSDQFAVRVIVNKMVSDRSSKRVKFKTHPGSRTSVKAKGQFIEDDEGSGATETDDVPNKRIHLKDHEVSLKQRNDKASRAHVKKNRKGKRRMKLWKGMDRTEEINVAEGRRVFESRRRINMANKQINPQHWANILAKVRGKSLPRTTTAIVPSSGTTTETPFMHKTPRTPPPIPRPPSKTVVEPPVNAEESSADIPHFGEVELFTVPPIISAQDHNHDQTPSTVVSTKPSVEHELSSPEETTQSIEIPIAQDANISPTDQSPAWDHSDLRTENPLAAPTGTGTFTSGPSNEEVITSLPLFQSTLITVDNGDRATQTTFFSTELPFEAVVSAEIHASDGPETDSQQNNMNILDNANVIHSMHSQINYSMKAIATTTIFAPASPIKDSVLLERERVEDQQVHISSDPYRSSEGVILKNTHVQKPESTSTVKSTTTPFQQKDWIMTAVTTNRLITAYERKITSSNSQAIPHPRRRPYGRRRLRPNRFRRPKPTASATEETPYIQKITKIEAATQSLQGFIVKDNQKPDTETQATNEYKVSKVSSSLTTSASALQRSTKIQDTEGSSVLRFPTMLPQTLVTLSNNVNDQKNGRTVSTYNILTATPNVQMHLSHKSEHQLTTSPDRKSINDFESDAVATNDEVRDAQTTSSLVSIGTSTSSTLPSGRSVIPEFEKVSVPIGSSAPENGVNPRLPQPGPGTVQPLAAVDNMAEHFKNLQTVNELQKLSESLMKTTLAPASHQRETVTLPHYNRKEGQLFTLSEPKQAIKPWHERTHIITSSGHTKETTTPPRNNQDQTPIHGTEKKYSPVLPLAPASFATTSPPLMSSVSPDTKGSNADSARTKFSSRQNEFFPSQSQHNRIATRPKQEQVKEPYSGRTHNSLPLNPNVPHQPIGVIPVFRQPPAFPPPKHIPVRGTVKPPRLFAPGLFHHFVTPQAPLHYTNKPEITAYAAQTTQGRKTSSPHTETLPTTTATPLYRPNLRTPDKRGNHGETRYSTHSQAFANFLPDTRDKPGRTIINPAVPYFPNPGTPFLYNRTRVFQHLGGNSRPVLPHWQAPLAGTTEKKFLSPTRTVTQSTSLRITGILVPPLSTAVSAVITPPVVISPSIKSQVTSTVQSSRSVHYSNPNVLFVPKGGGVKALNSSIIQPSTNMRTQGERPKIVTKGSNSLSILAESDAVIPCDATGEPKPFLSWTKLSTGALMPANTRIQRFEVLKNGTFIIRNVQLQDRGQYLCTAQNQHGVDKMMVLLTVLAQQPRMMGSRFRDVTVYFGEQVTMDCQANGIPSPHLSWIFPDRKILQTVSTAEGRVMLYGNRTLTLKDTSFSDRGVYKCIASNAAGADSIAVRLHIAALPPIIQQEKQENISLNVGQNINIHCSAKAAPLPNIRWVIFDGTQIRTSQFVHGNLFVFPNGTLYIRNVLPKDSGSYECIAANMVGAARRTVWLHVKKQSTNAKITGTSPQRTDVTYGSTLRLDCSASGDPWPRILWRLPSKRMVDSLHR
ncbi:hypothetical protein lerEdw1_016618 [Lerista edwardsae]|nr:hypothetical protein lerEdw1_016618 [Lerista edwardsae]